MDKQHKKAPKADEWKPHMFYPSYQHMGDCAHCGHIRENCERMNAEHALRLGSADGKEGT